MEWVPTLEREHAFRLIDLLGKEGWRIHVELGDSAPYVSAYNHERTLGLYSSLWDAANDTEVSVPLLITLVCIVIRRYDEKLKEIG